MPTEVADACLRDAAAAPRADPAVGYPRWYLHRWHFLPEGYLSRRSVVRYERVVRRLYNVLHEEQAHRAIAAVLGKRQAREIVDIGCGSGRLLQTVARLLPEARLHGVDLSPYMLERAAERTGGVRLVHADGAALPFAARSLDAAIAVHVIGHTPAEAASALLHEAARVLRPGGVLVVLDHAWHRLPTAGWRESMSHRLAGGTLALRVLETPAELA